MAVLTIYDDRCLPLSGNGYAKIYHGILANWEGYDPPLPGAIYYVRLVMRPFNPQLVVALTCPTTKRTWALSNDCYGYRSAATSGALLAKDGEWYSRCETKLRGGVKTSLPVRRGYALVTERPRTRVAVPRSVYCRAGQRPNLPKTQPPRPRRRPIGLGGNRLRRHGFHGRNAIAIPHGVYHGARHTKSRWNFSFRH